MEQGPLRLERAGTLTSLDSRHLRWLDAFGSLIGNTDRHFGNITLFADSDGGPYRLAPVYDMLPMFLAPADSRVVEREFAPQPPTSSTLDVWHGAAAKAVQYWESVLAAPELSPPIRARASACSQAVADLASGTPGISA